MAHLKHQENTEMRKAEPGIRNRLHQNHTTQAKSAVISQTWLFIRIVQGVYWTLCLSWNIDCWAPQSGYPDSTRLGEARNLVPFRYFLHVSDHKPEPGIGTSFLFVSLFFFLGCTYNIWNSQTRGRIGAAAASLHHSPRNTGSEPRLQPTPQLMATMPDPRPTEQGLMDTSWIHYHWATRGTPETSEMNDKPS